MCPFNRPKYGFNRFVSLTIDINRSRQTVYKTYDYSCIQFVELKLIYCEKKKLQVIKLCPINL